MSNEDFDWDPSVPPNVADPVGTLIHRQQQRALINAWGDPEDDPERASRAVQLSNATGVHPALIYGDQENFEEQHKLALTSELLRNNKFLMDYAADPMLAKVSRDDWGRLDEYTRALEHMAPRQKTAAIPAAKAAIQAAYDSFDAQRAFRPPLPPDWISNSRVLSNLWTAASGPGGPLFGFSLGTSTIPELFGAGLAGLQAGGREYLTLLGLPRDTAEGLSKEVTRMLEARIMRLEGLGHQFIGHIPTEEIIRGAKAWEKARPFVESGEMPPPGNNDITDEAHRLQAKQDDKLDKEAIAKAHATATIDTPEAFEALTRLVVGDTKIGISATTLAKLYGDEVPAIGDGKLGDLAGVREQYEWALRNGKDVQVPLTEWMARVDPDVKDEVREGLRWRSSGITLEESKRPPPEVAEPEAGAPLPSVIDTVREASGLVPTIVGKARPALPPEGVIPEGSLLGQIINQRGYDAVAAGSFSLRDGLAQIKNDKLDDFHAALNQHFAERLSELVGDTKVHVLNNIDFNSLGKLIRIGDDPKRFSGWFDPETGDIIVRRSAVEGQLGHQEAAGMLLHEGSHALTYQAMRDRPEVGKIFDDMRLELINALDKAGSTTLKKKIGYYLANYDEFVAGGYDNKLFRETLATTPISEGLASRVGLVTGKGQAHTLWDAFRQKISDIFYWILKKRFDNTMLDAFLKMQEHFEESAAGEGEGAVVGAPSQPQLPGMTRMEDRPLFERAAQIGLSGKRYEKWVKAINERAEEKAKLEKAQQLREETLRQSQEWKSTLKETRKTVEDELRSRPDFASDKFFREGGEIGGRHIRKQRLDAKAIPEDLKGRIPADYIGDRGLTPDQANIFGFDNGRALLTSLARLEDERKLAGLTPEAHLRATIDAEAERRVREQLGQSHKEMMKEIEDHVYSPATIDMVSEEMLGMAEKAGAQLPISGANAKAWVKEQFSAGKMGTHSFKTYQAAAQRMETLITDALQEDKPVDAFQNYQRKVISMLSANEASKLEKEQAKADTLFKRLSKRIVEQLPEEFTNAIHQLMARGGFNLGLGPGGIRRTAADLAERMDVAGPKDLGTFVEGLQKVGFPELEVPDFLLTGWAKPQEDMTVSEWRDWSGMIRSLYNIGRRQNTFLKQGAELDLRDFVGQAKAQIAKHGPELPKTKTQSKFKDLTSQLQSIAYSLVWQESVNNRLDFGDPYGLFNTAFSYPANRAVNQYTAWIKQFSKELSALEKSHVADRSILPQIFKDYEGKYITDLNHDNLRQALLYAGTDTGYQKLIRGWMLADVPKEQRNAAFPLAAQRFEQWIADNATKEDWEYVGKVWDVNKRIFEKYEGMTGELGVIPAQKIALRSMTDKWGRKWDGGYTKLIYDRDEVQSSAKAAGINVKDPDEALGSNLGIRKASTPRSHEIERTGYIGPLYLKTDKNPGTMSQVLRDAAIRPFIVNTSKVWGDAEFRKALRDRGFKHVQDMLDPYLEAIAGKGERVDAASKATQQWLDYFSRSTVSRLIGWSPTTAAKHGLSAAINSVMEIGVKMWTGEWGTMRTSGDLKDFYRALAPNIDLGDAVHNQDVAMYRSQQLQERSKSILETMGGQVERLAGRRNVWERMGDWFERNNSAIVAWADLESAKPTWIGAFKQSIIDQTEKLGDVNLTTAEDVADRAVRRAHGSTSMATRPSAMRGNAMQMTILRLYGYWNSLLQRNYEAMWRTKYAAENFEKKNYAEGLKQIPAITWLLVSSQLGPMLVEYAVEGVPNDKKDSPATKVAKQAILIGTSTIPIFREAVRGYLYGYPTTMGILDTALGGVHDAIKDLDMAHWGAKAFDAEHGGKTIRALTSVFTSATRIGNDEIGKLAKTLWDSTHRNRETPKTPYELGREMIKAHPREQHR